MFSKKQNTKRNDLFGRWHSAAEAYCSARLKK